MPSVRAAMIGLLGLALADATPRGDLVDESKWFEGEFVSAANQPLDRLVASGNVVGLQISGRGESVLLRKRTYPLRLPCRLAFRVRWSESKFEGAYPSLHVIFDPPEDGEWWKAPTARGGRYWNGMRTFLFHFSTSPDWRKIGPTSELEHAEGVHGYSSPKGEWVDLVLRLESNEVTVLQGTKEVAKAKVDLGSIDRYTWAIGDQTSTFVELDSFRASGGR
jgi:hypothetical protein